uniref:Carboxylesterase type B domain-containing protein n=1 Tax=Acrobeloides nanus TaxID=290746 RepID=A0A914CEJ1_9BILA
MWNSGNYNQLKDCLYNISVEDALKYDYSYVGNAVCWNFVQDNNFFPDIPKNLAKTRKEKPMIIGTNRDEWAAPYWTRSNITNFTREFVEGYLAERFINFFGSATQDSIELFENIYLEPGTADDDHLAWYKLIIDLGTTFFFTGGAAEDVELHIWNNNSNIFLYEFTYSKENFGNTGYYPVIHGAELTYLFMIWDQHNINETDVQLANFFGESWTNFAKNGKPTTDDSWKPVTTTDLLNMEYLDINPNRGMKAGYRVLDRIQFTRVMPILVGPLPPAIPDYNNGSRIGCPEGWTVSATNSKKCFNIYHFSPLSQTDALKNFKRSNLYQILYRANGTWDNMEMDEWR